MFLDPLPTDPVVTTPLDPKDPKTWTYYTNRFYCGPDDKVKDCGAEMVFKGGECVKGNIGELVQP